MRTPDNIYINCKIIVLRLLAQFRQVSQQTSLSNALASRKLMVLTHYEAHAGAAAAWAFIVLF